MTYFTKELIKFYSGAVILYSVLDDHYETNVYYFQDKVKRNWEMCFTCLKVGHTLLPTVLKSDPRVLLDYCRGKYICVNRLRVQHGRIFSVIVQQCFLV